MFRKLALTLAALTAITPVAASSHIVRSGIPQHFAWRQGYIEIHNDTNVPLTVRLGDADGRTGRHSQTVDAGHIGYIVGNVQGGFILAGTRYAFRVERLAFDRTGAVVPGLCNHVGSPFGYAVMYLDGSFTYDKATHMYRPSNFRMEVHTDCPRG